MAKKLTENMLLEAWIKNCLCWADLCDTVEEYEDLVKDLKKHRTRAKALIKKSREHYKKMIGAYPTICARDKQWLHDPFLESK
jgi:hypothetical protein